jgi:hypothetical protein
MKKTILLPLAFAALLFSAGKSNAQTVSILYNGHDISFSKDTCAQLTLFTGRYCEGKNYLHWDVTNQECGGVYIIYRSCDGKSYEILGHKQGIGVPISSPIAYYFQDVHPLSGNNYYVLVHVGENKSYMKSEKISITVNEEIASK